jgi:hypothetical protein
MQRDQILLTKRNKAIVQRFNVLSDIRTPKGKMKYSYDYIYEKISNEYYLSVYTVTKIIKNG